MSPKTALKILSGIVAILVVVFFIFWYHSKKQNEAFTPEKTSEEKAAIIENAINKKNQGKELDENEQKTLETYVNEKVDEKKIELQQKPEAEIKQNGYTQDEVDFILDPQKATEENLGIINKPQNKPLTQEEIDKILNP